MQPEVRVLMEHGKILRPIIQRIAIDVMNMLVRFQPTPKHLFH